MKSQEKIQKTTSAARRRIHNPIHKGYATFPEHVHPGIGEVFTVATGSVGFRLDGREDLAGPGRRVVVAPGVIHYWWIAGDAKAHVVVEPRGEARLLDGFVTMLSNAFGMARDGKTDAEGRPNLLQAALFAGEFDDVIRFVEPPRGPESAVRNSRARRAAPRLPGRLPPVRAVGIRRGGALARLRPVGISPTATKGLIGSWCLPLPKRAGKARLRVILQGGRR